MSSLPPIAPSHALWLGRGSFGVLFLTFVGMLGGFHPPNQTRDTAVLVAAILVVALNVPLAAWIARAVRVPEHRRAAIMTGVALVVRLVFAAWLLRFIASISHEGRP